MRRRKEKEIPSNANDDNTTTGSRAANTKENGTLLSEPPYDDLDFPRWGYLIILCVLLITFSPVIIHFLLLSPRLVSQGIFLNSILNWPLPYAGSLTKLGDTLSGVQNVRTEVPESRGEFLRGYRIIADDDFIPPSDTVELVDKWFFPAALPLPQASKTASRCAILFFHGNGSNRGLGWRIKHARALSSLSLPCGNLGAKEDGEHDNNVVFAYDVRCFGDSYCPKGAVLDEAGVRSDALTIYKDISNDFDQVYVYGHSLGTAIGSALVADACEFIDECKIKGLILDSPFTSLDVVATVHPFMLPLRAFVGASYYAERIQHIQFNTKETLARFITKKSRRQDNVSVRRSSGEFTGVVCCWCCVLCVVCCVLCVVCY